MNPILLLGVLILNRPDLLLRMINSIDYPIDKLAIVQNSSAPDVTEAVDQIMNTIHPFINEIYLQVNFKNSGVAPAWNTIIKSFPECQIWMIANNDTVFLPGDLEKYYATWEANQSSVIVAANGAFSCFIISPHIVSKIGLFDENIWPIYDEDSDFYIRMKRAGIKRIPISSDIGYSNDGSWTIKSNIDYKLKNNYTQQNNSKYLHEKWGENLEYDIPYNHPTRDIHDWWYDPYRRQQHSQIWNNFEETANKTENL